MPTIAEALAFAVGHYQARRMQEAEQICRQVLAVDANNVTAWNLLGVIANEAGRHDVAIECFKAALGIEPQLAELHFNLGNALRDGGYVDDAIASFRRAIEQQPNLAGAYNNLGILLRSQGKAKEAFEYFQQAVRIDPDQAEAQNSLGACWLELGRPDEAAACFERALATNLQSVEAHHNLGNARKDQARLEEAIASYRRATELCPWDASLHSSLLHTLNYCPGYDAPLIYEECRRWNDQHAAPLANQHRPHTNDRSPGRRLRIGYVSPDFREHVQSLFMLPLLAAHDQEQFEICCYASVLRPDHTTERIRLHADRWQDIVSLNDTAAAELVRADQIDILVDLTMHMERSRLLLFARRPAPVQVTWLAYPGTTGLASIDYRLTDRYLDPPGMFDSYYAEESVHLPETFWCYDSLTSHPAVNSLPARQTGRITFGSLNNFCKVNASVLRLWTHVLRKVPRSQLLLLAPEGSSRQWVSVVLQKEGIAPDRIAFVSRQPRARYLELYQQIDIGLDTLPANGHTTSLDSFWMGVPVVTLVGPTAVGRAGLSQLSNLGLTELAADSSDAFVRIAAELASDLDHLSRLRAALRQRMQASPLMDAPRFARNLESAYRRMWQRWCAESA
jgi:predicted O-linked N-acetylglucosamine transferase (SPINDLY family)